MCKQSTSARGRAVTWPRIFAPILRGTSGRSISGNWPLYTLVIPEPDPGVILQKNKTKTIKYFIAGGPPPPGPRRMTTRRSSTTTRSTSPCPWPAATPSPRLYASPPQVPRHPAQTRPLSSTLHPRMEPRPPGPRGPASLTTWTWRGRLTRTPSTPGPGTSSPAPPPSSPAPGPASSSGRARRLPPWQWAPAPPPPPRWSQPRQPPSTRPRSRVPGPRAQWRPPAPGWCTRCPSPSRSRHSPSPPANMWVTRGHGARRIFRANTDHKINFVSLSPPRALLDTQWLTLYIIVFLSLLLLQSPGKYIRLSPKPYTSSPKSPLRRPRGDAKKCRKVYGMEHRELWCTQCKWKKACTRFGEGA